MKLEPAVGNGGSCPFLIPVIRDWLWLNPVGAYCRRPDGRVRVPSRQTTVPCICQTPAHLLCPGYLQSTRPPEAIPA